eukprot:3933651-Rhodomonas_salina.2
MTSHLFQHHIFLAARRQKQRIVLPEGDDWRVCLILSPFNTSETKAHSNMPETKAQNPPQGK